jgi:MFS family permease
VIRPSLTRSFPALQVRNYRLFWFGQVVSRTGTWMQQVSLPWLVLALGGSPIELGLVAALEFTPALVLAPFGGVYADRVDKRRAIFITQLLATLQVVVLFVLTVTGLISIALIMVLSFALGIVNAVETPLRQTLAADLVPRKNLANAIALNAMAFNGARIIGPAIAGVTIAVGTHLFRTVTAGVAFNLAINAVSFVAVLISVMRMNPLEIRQPHPPAQTIRVLDSLAEGIAYAIRTPIVLWSLIFLAVVEIFGDNFRILLPLFTQDVLDLGADAYGGLYAAIGVGAFFGAATLALLNERRVIALMLGGGIAFGLGLVLLSLTTTVVVAAPILMAAGFAWMLMINTANAAIQSNVSDHLRGRVMSLYVTVMHGSTPIGGMFAGAVAQSAGVPTAFMVGGLAAMATVALVWTRLRTSRLASHGESRRDQVSAMVEGSPPD